MKKWPNTACNGLTTLDDMMQTSMPQGYLFDMDGLLLDTERVGLQSFLTVCETFDIERGHAEPFFLSLIGGSREVNAAKSEQFLGRQVCHKEFEIQWLAHKDRLMHEGVPLRPFVRDVIGALAASGAKMAVVTSTIGERARAELARAGLLDHFELVVAGDEVRANKPDPAPYLQGAAALGLDPKHCAAFEDSDTGITAAVRAGCRAVQIPDLRPQNKPLPDLGHLVASDLRAALALVAPDFKSQLI